MDPSFWRELAITQIATAATSLTASTTLASFVLVTRKPVDQSIRRGGGSSSPQPSKLCGECRWRFLGLSSPYRRIIFGLSFSDILFSTSAFAGPWLAVEGNPFAPWAKGNIHTCRLGGLLGAIGHSAVPMYTLFLCVFYLCKLKWKMTDDQFAKKIEMKTHAAIIVFNLVVYFTALGLDLFNTSVLGTLCYLSRRPTGCQLAPDIFGECENPLSQRVVWLSNFHSIITPLICLAGCIGCIGIIILQVMLRERIFGRSKTSSQEPVRSSRYERIAANFSVGSDVTDLHDAPSQSTNKPDVSTEEKVVRFDEEINATSDTGSHRRERPLRQKTAVDSVEIYRTYRRELLGQALSYIAIFCISYLPILAVNLTLHFNKPVPAALNRVLVVCFPLGGLFNILAFVRPNVACLRRMHPRLSRLRALWLVFKAGGEVPDDIPATYFGCCLDHENRRTNRKYQSEEVETSESRKPVPSTNYGWENISADSKLCVDGCSESLEESNAAYNGKKVSYAEGGKGSVLNAIEEIDSDLVISSNEILVSQQLSQLSMPPVRDEIDSMEEIWADTFHRVQNYKPST